MKTLQELIDETKDFHTKNYLIYIQKQFNKNNTHLYFNGQYPIDLGVIMNEVPITVVSLDLHNGTIRDINPLRNLPPLLISLNLCYCDIFDITPLQNLPASLLYLYLNHNKILLLIK